MTDPNSPRQKNAEETSEKRPLSIRETLSILIAGHIGVRKASQRAEDFGRARGVNVFFAAVAYFSVIVFCLVLLVRYIVG
ncbi:MAG: DUF2970 domain-containing protein [Proteobacteria bacterium]|nr:DUF2970 domain-containing protein [Pseudomonadota bacterium]